jgi:hypothetical protein
VRGGAVVIAVDIDALLAVVNRYVVIGYGLGGIGL